MGSGDAASYFRRICLIITSSFFSKITNLSSFLNSLGSTRFFKVALSYHPATECRMVVKVFTIQDLSINLRSDRDKLIDMKRALEGCVNCLPFQRVFVSRKIFLKSSKPGKRSRPPFQLTERAGFIIRQYVKHSLYDRMSTRPFLTSTEKTWMAFQLLLALQQAHKHGVCHGDVKLENVGVTAWNWVYLMDFASFKPTYLPRPSRRHLLLR